MTGNVTHVDQPVTVIARKDFTLLRQSLTVEEALDTIRRQDIGETIVYFYIVDEEDRLVGVVPTCRLLTAALHEPLSSVMISRVISIPHTASILDACEFFVMYRLLAFPTLLHALRLDAMKRPHRLRAAKPIRLQSPPHQACTGTRCPMSLQQ
jgi:magnesium transporter